MNVAAAIRSRNAADLPGKRDEDWRWTDLRGLIRAVPDPSAHRGELPAGPDAPADEVIVVANGRAAHIDALPGQSQTVALRTSRAGRRMRPGSDQRRGGRQPDPAGEL